MIGMVFVWDAGIAVCGGNYRHFCPCHNLQAEMPENTLCEYP
jgi:hypothetical protein